MTDLSLCRKESGNYKGGMMLLDYTKPHHTTPCHATPAITSHHKRLTRTSRKIKINFHPLLYLYSRTHPPLRRSSRHVSNKILPNLHPISFWPTFVFDLCQKFHFSLTVSLINTSGGILIIHC